MNKVEIKLKMLEDRGENFGDPDMAFDVEGLMISHDIKHLPDIGPVILVHIQIYKHHITYSLTLINVT